MSRNVSRKEPKHEPEDLLNSRSFAVENRSRPRYALIRGLAP